MTTVAPSQRSYVFEDRLEKGIQLKEVRIACRQSVKTATPWTNSGASLCNIFVWAGGK
jgi:hypothetical protein